MEHGAAWLAVGSFWSDKTRRSLYRYMPRARGGVRHVDPEGLKRLEKEGREFGVWESIRALHINDSKKGAARGWIATSTSA